MPGINGLICKPCPTRVLHSVSLTLIDRLESPTRCLRFLLHFFASFNFGQAILARVESAVSRRENEKALNFAKLNRGNAIRKVHMQLAIRLCD